MTEVIEISDGKADWDPNWTDAQPREDSVPFAPSPPCDTEIDETPCKDCDKEMKEADVDWLWSHDGARWWIGCPAMMTKEEVLKSCGPITEVPYDGDEASWRTDLPALTVPKTDVEKAQADEDQGNQVKDKADTGVITNKDNKTDDNDKKEAKNQDEPANAFVTPKKNQSPTPAEPEKPAKRAKKEAGEISWTPLTKRGYDDFIDSCNGCGREVHDPPQDLPPKVSEKMQEPNVIWRPCIQTGLATFNQFFGQVFPETLALGDFVAYVIGLGDDWTSVPSSTPSYVVEIMKYVSNLCNEWGLDDPSEVDYWVRQRSGSVKTLWVDSFCNALRCQHNVATI